MQKYIFFKGHNINRKTFSFLFLLRLCYMFHAALKVAIFVPIFSFKKSLHRYTNPVSYLVWFEGHWTIWGSYM